MKVLFAVSNEEISESIVKRYQKEYKEIISYKNVYYFNAILKELQKDKSYDRIVISEELEAYANTQYDQIDKFIFDRLLIVLQMLLLSPFLFLVYLIFLYLLHIGVLLLLQFLKSKMEYCIF